MKKLLTLSAFIPSLLLGQSLVGTAPEHRTGFLEDFTGIHCVYCPEGHTIMTTVANAHPGLVSLVGVHAGSFAVPSTGQPDFRTTFGTTLNNYFGVSGYPSGIINRRPYNGATVLGRNLWAAAMDQVLALPSPVNLGMASSFDNTTRLLTVQVQLYYTAASPGGDDRISVLLTENHITGFQTTPQGNNANYDHTHVLRTYLTELWGDAVTTPAAGTTVDRTYTFTVPTTWNIANCEVTALVSEMQTEVYQARTVPAVGGTTLVTGALAADPMPYRNVPASQSTAFDMNLTNAMGAESGYVVTLTATDAPATWASAITVAGASFTSGSTTTVADAATAQITVQITPDAMPGIGNYILTVSAVDHPMAPVLQQDFHVISGVHDLIVTNPDAEPWDALYSAAMVQANEAAYAKTSRDRFIKFGQANALGGVLNIYRNVSWTFPSLTNDEVAQLIPFMDNGGNLMIAGQDIGWDQSGATGSSGTSATQAFYSGYMHAHFRWDGSTANSTVNFVDDDAVFGAVPNSSIANVFAGSTYPDRITPLSPATAILTYNAPDSIGGIRAQTSAYKLVYFGVGPEQMANATVGRQMVQLSHDWFYGTVGFTAFDAAMATLGNPYPVPADGKLTIPMAALSGTATLQVFDAMGHLVKALALTGSPSLLEVDTRDLANGTYAYRICTSGNASSAKTFVVVH